MTFAQPHPDAIAALCYGDHGAPFDILGAHRLDSTTLIVRALRPDARDLTLIINGEGRHPMTCENEHGLYSVTITHAGDSQRITLKARPMRVRHWQSSIPTALGNC